MNNKFKYLFLLIICRLFDCFFLNDSHFYLIGKLNLITFFKTFYKNKKTFVAKNC